MAAHALAPLLANTWFARALLPHLARAPMEVVAAIRILADAASVAPSRRIEMLVNYLTATGVIKRESG